MGNATPLASPAQTKADGEVITLNDNLTTVTDLEHVGDLLALRSGTTLAVGKLADFKKNTTTTISLDANCGDITATEASEEFIFACPDGVYAVGADKKKALIVPTDTPQTVAVKTSDGVIITGASDNNKVQIHTDTEVTTVTVEDGTDQMIAVPTDSGPDTIYRINREHTLIQNVTYQDGKPGAILRVGLGVGQIAGGENGLAIAADTIGKQFGIYLAQEIIRLHQTTPTANESAWTVAWDATNKYVWAATTTDNKLRGYSIAAGVGEQQQVYNSIPDVQNFVVLTDGTLIAASATGAGLQVINPEK